MSDITQKVLERIEHEHIEPKPRWACLLRRWVVWALAGLSFLVGSVATSMVFFVVLNDDWDVAHHFHGEFPWPLLVVPFVWLFVFAVFVFVADYQFRHTKTGYRYSLPIIIASSVFGSVVLGFVLYCVGVSHMMDEKMPMPHEERKALRWVQPEKGRLAGDVISKGVEEFTLRDFGGNVWFVTVHKKDPVNQSVVMKYSQVRVLGNELSQNQFLGCMIRPWVFRKSAFHEKKYLHHMKHEMKEMEEHILKISHDEREFFEARSKDCETFR